MTTRIKISNFKGFGPQFANIIEGTEHDVVNPPKEYKKKFPNGRTGYWIMGVGQPVRILPDEFIKLD